MSLAIVASGQPIARLLAALASACVLVMVMIWAVWIYPINKAVNSWTCESVTDQIAALSAASTRGSLKGTRRSRTPVAS